MWRNPKIVPEKFQSTVTEIVTVLVAAPAIYDQPMPGYYLEVLGEWRILGSPSDHTNKVIAWQPKPAMPREDELLWLKKSM